MKLQTKSQSPIGNKLNPFPTTTMGILKITHLELKGEHAHDYFYDENSKLYRGDARELTENERKENDDIL